MDYKDQLIKHLEKVNGKELFLRYFFKSKEGITIFNISHKNYIKKTKKGLLIFISFEEYKCLNLKYPMPIWK